MIGTGLA